MRLNFLTGGSLALLLLALTPVRALGDSWGRHESDVRIQSENGDYVAIFEPPVQESERPWKPVGRGRVTVYDNRSSSTLPVWRSRLANSYFPHEMLLDNSGRFLVSLNDWGHVGYGENVFVFYDAGKKVANYSLEEALPLEEYDNRYEPANKGTLYSVSSQHYPFRESTSSRWWNQDCIQIFSDIYGKRSFCIWIIWANRWFAWDLQTGDKLLLGERELAILNATARQRSLKNIEGGSFRITDLAFLTAHRSEQDRSIFENLLANRYSHCSAGLAYRGWDGVPDFNFNSAYPYRKLADLYLASAASIAVDDVDQMKPWIGRYFGESDPEYKYLGTATGEIHVPPDAWDGTGMLWMCLFPQPGNNMNSEKSPLIHPMAVDLDYFVDWEDEDVREVLKNGVLPFKFEGILPGQYRVKLLWDRTEPFMVDTASVDVRDWLRTISPFEISPSLGDYVGELEQVIEIRAGEITATPELPCLTLVEDEIQSARAQ